MEPKEFKDKNGDTIKAGDVIERRFIARWRENPGHSRVAFDMMGNERIQKDEGLLREPVQQWVRYHVKWSGACLIAERGECSDFQALMQAELFDEKGKRISEGSGFHYLNSVFDSTSYKIV